MIRFLVLGFLLTGVLMIPGMNDVEALTDAECLSLSGLSTIEQNYTVVTCENPFDENHYNTYHNQHKENCNPYPIQL